MSLKVEYWETHDATVTHMKYGNLTFQFKEMLYTAQSYRAQGVFHMIEG